MDIENLPTKQLEDLRDKIKSELQKRCEARTEKHHPKCRVVFRERSTGRFYEADGTYIDPATLPFK